MERNLHTMKKNTDRFNPKLAVGQRILGYEIQKIVELPEIASFFYELKHRPTGARHIHISRQDKENSFCVAFKTVPEDSTGVAHILEHTVLCGSEKYPVRDPFFAMIKRSLNSFMNALTASDWTMYPFSTQNKKDYYNLMRVYLDAAFFPKLDRLSFKQEGHRLEPETDPHSQTARLVYKGVVYNEMKGAMSSPDQVMTRSILNALYPDTTYGFNSGGDPAEIPNLTHEQLKAFHHRHYHPSNAFFYTYGNLPLKQHLKLIEKMVLSRFKRIDPKTEVPNQPRWEKPKTAEYRYPLDPSEDPQKKCQVCLAWLTADIRDAFEVLVLSILEQVLMGNSGSPLRKALIESGLGSTLSDGSGFDSENKDTLFSCGLKDVEASSAEKIERIILNTLKTLAETGIDKQMVESAIHQIEFHRKEVTNHPFPYGLNLLLRFTGDWFHGGDPAASLKVDTLMNRLFAELKQERFLEDRIRLYFLENPHRVRLMLLPDQKMAEAENRRVAEALEQIKKHLSDQEMESLQKDALALAALQESKEDLSCLPTLEIKDISPEIVRIKKSPGYVKAECCCYEQPTSGILYFTFAAGLKGLPSTLLPLVPFFCNAVTRCGTALHSYSEIAQMIDLYTGGIGLSATAGASFSPRAAGACFPLISFNAKCLSRNLEKMFELLEEVLCGYRFADTNRLRQLLLEYRADLEASVVANGHRYAVSLASRSLSAVGALNELWHGIHQLDAIKQLTEDLSEKNLQSIANRLKRIGEAVLRANNIKTALIGEKQDLLKASACLKALKNRLGEGGAFGFESPKIRFPQKPVREGWATSSAVSFTASVFETKPLNHPDAPALAVISKILRSLFLHREIREKGGAYGGFASYQLETGLFAFGSYRDPHIVNTLEVYDRAAAFITSGNYTAQDIKEAILQVCADIDRPDPPSTAAMKGFYRELVQLTDGMRQTFKNRLLKLNRNKILTAANRYFGPSRGPFSVAVISSEEALKKANTRLARRPLKLHRI